MNRLRILGARLWLLAVLILMALPVVLWAQDSTAVIPTPGEGVTWLLAAGLSALAMLFTKAGKWIAGKLDGTTAEADEYLTKLYKPFQPVVAMGLAILLAKVHFLHGSVPSGELLAAAPITTIVGVSLRELYLKFFGKK